MSNDTLKPAFSAFDDYTGPEYQISSLGLQKDIPPAFEDLSADEPEFDPDIHLAIEEPTNITLLDFSVAKTTPAVSGVTQSKLGWTAPFRLLSDEGVRVLRQIVEKNKRFARSCERIPCYIRGIAYTSKFVRALNEHPRILDALSRFSGHRVVPHYLHMNYSHVNIGKLPDPGKKNDIPVDQWHTDSVPFVLIIILSDLTDMVGGELECVKRVGRDAGFELIKSTGNNVPESELLRVNYQRQGYALFMQGSEIVHHVQGVQSAVEPRITVVNSYMPANAYSRDRTVYDTFIAGGDEEEALLEFARGRANRAAQQLLGFVNNQSYTTDPKLCVEFLNRVVSELQMSSDLISFKVRDGVGFINEKTLKDSLAEREEKQKSTHDK